MTEHMTHDGVSYVERQSESGTDGGLWRHRFYFRSWITSLPDWEQTVCLRGDLACSHPLFTATLIIYFLDFKGLSCRLNGLNIFSSSANHCLLVLPYTWKRFFITPQDIFFKLAQSPDCVVKIPNLLFRVCPQISMHHLVLIYKHTPLWRS